MAQPPEAKTKLSTVWNSLTHHGQNLKQLDSFDLQNLHMMNAMYLRNLAIARYNRHNPVPLQISQTMFSSAVSHPSSITPGVNSTQANLPVVAGVVSKI